MRFFALKMGNKAITIQSNNLSFNLLLFLLNKMLNFLGKMLNNFIRKKLKIFLSDF